MVVQDKVTRKPEATSMRFAYADPPYLGCCGMYDHFHGDDGLCWDDPATHAALIQRLERDFPDGWALSCTSQSLPTMLWHCPDGIRVGAWVKPFASFRPNVTPAFAWEPVIFRGGRRRQRNEWSGRDWVSAMPPVFSGENRDGVSGMKPEAFCFWLFDLLGVRPTDEFVDIFHGSGAVKRAWDAFQRQPDFWRQFGEALGAAEQLGLNDHCEEKETDASNDIRSHKT